MMDLHKFICVTYYICHARANTPVFKRVENAKRWNEVCYGDSDMQMCHSLTHSLTHSGVDTLRN